MSEVRIKTWAFIAGILAAMVACLVCLAVGAGAAYLFLRADALPSRARTARLRPPAAAPLGFQPVTGGTGSVRAGEIISVNFAGVATKKGKAAIGDSADDFWNHYHFPFAQQATLEDLKTSAGRPTGVLLQTHTLTGEWGFTSPDPMWASFSYSETDQGCLRFPNLPPGGYDLYLFMHSAGDPDPAKDWGSFGRARVEAGGRDYGLLATEASAEFLSADWKEGIHYVVFRDVEIRSGGMLNITLLRGGNNAKPSINGLQLRRAR